MCKDRLRILTGVERRELNELLHNELVLGVLEGDTTVLFEIIENLDNIVAFNSLSDKGQKLLLKNFKDG
jgi:hypothetical protein